MHTAEKSLLLGAHPRINAGFVASCHPPRLGRTPAPSKAPRRRMITVAGSVPTQGPREPQPRPSILPAGKRQARVDLPALFLSVSADQLARSPGTVDDITAAVAGGATAVLLREGTSGGATKLYEAVIAVKEALRGRAALLVQDRTDIADAAGADGVLLSPAGLPTVVAKGMLQSGSALVGRAVADGDAAVQAAAEGASFVVVQTSGGSPTAEAVASARQQRSGASVPVLVELTSNLESGVLQGLLNAGANGILLDLDALSPVAVAATMEPQGTITEAAASLLQCLSQSVRGSSVHQNEEGGEGEGAEAGSMPVAQLSQLLSPGREEVVAAEKETLQRLLDFLASACPALEETSLLRDAVQQLDELFLVVVVGEFNSGKSAVINALLGRRVLAEGILPTTNEISVLKWADPADPEAERAEQTSDGMFVRYIPADLLKEVNVVDTPGTNVILDRQQRLTEEFVPRADLVLFVMSADRPFTDSEVRFLRYIRQWGKKVVFVVNKVDLLTSESEVAEVSSFVEENARRLLGVDGARVVPVSARLAAEAKLACRAAERDEGTGSLTLSEQMRLASEPGWAASRFEGLESFVRDFLLGGDGGEESVRLKLRTPLFVAEALLAAARTQLEAEAVVARADAASVGLVRSQMAQFRAEMAKEGLLQRQEVARQLAEVARRACDVVDATLQLSNWESLSAYVLGPGARGGRLPVAARYQQEVPKEATARLGELVQEHTSWLATNCQRQADNYRGFAAARAAALGRSFDSLLDTEALELERDPEARRRWRQLREAAAAGSGGGTDSTLDDAASEAVTVLDPQTTEAMLEEEVREAVLSTASSAAGAGAVGVLLTTVLPTTLEDILALGLSAAIGYASILNLPLRRAEAKKKVDAAATAAAANIQGKMEAELTAALERCQAEVMSLIEPLEELMAEEVRRAEEALAAQEALAEEVAQLQRRAASVE